MSTFFGETLYIQINFINSYLQCLSNFLFRFSIFRQTRFLPQLKFVIFPKFKVLQWLANLVPWVCLRKCVCTIPSFLSLLELILRYLNVVSSTTVKGMRFYCILTRFYCIFSFNFYCSDSQNYDDYERNELWQITNLLYI